MLNLTDQEVSKYLSQFVWNFNLGSNLAYNFKILFLLYKNKEDAKNNNEIYNKPIIIFLVSIMEALLVDQLKRIDSATSDLPESITVENIYSMKGKITSEKINFTYTSDTGQRIQYKKIKKYNFYNIIKYYDENNLLFDNSGKIYKYLYKFADLRNRIHIENYYEKFNEYEGVIFTNLRLLLMEKILKYTLKTMATKYNRKLSLVQKNSNEVHWFNIIKSEF